MRKIRTLLIGFSALCAATAIAGAASAQTCGVTGGNLVSLGNYDPFNPTTISNVTTNVTLNRIVGGGGKKTQSVNFYFTKPAGSANFQILYNGTNVVYTEPTFAGAPVLNSGNSNDTPGLVFYSFGGAAAPDTVTLPFTVTIPTGVDLSAGAPIPFGIRFVCKGTGGLDDVNTPSTLANAFTLNVTVLSALQASYSGPAHAHGDVGTVSTGAVLAAPATYTKAGNVVVRSSGPYTVAVASTNNYQLKAPSVLGAIDYEAKFLGQTKTNASPTFTTTTCVRAGLTGVSLPISTRLLEGGLLETPGSYSDTINVTVSPVISGAGAVACPTP